jgi:hypothetical protein
VENQGKRIMSRKGARAQRKSNPYLACLASWRGDNIFVDEYRRHDEEPYKYMS